MSVKVVVACGKTEPKRVEAPPAVAVADAAINFPDARISSPDALESTEPVISNNDHVCSKVDMVALAKALGVPKLTLSRGNALITGGDGPNSLTCSWNEKPGATDVAKRGLNFGFSIEATTQLEAKDPLNRFVWEPYNELGQPAKIAVAYESLHMQTVVKGVLLHADIDVPTADPSRLDKRLLAATKLVMQQLPNDVANELK